MTIPLEDFFEDIIGKAQRGLGIETSGLAERTGLDREAIQALRRGELDIDAISKIAPELGLDTQTLIASAEKSWFPEQPEVPGLHVFHSYYGDMIVNAYLVQLPESREAIVFDTGTDCTEILNHLRSNNIDLAAICVTHSHPDHISDLDALRAAMNNPPSYIHEQEPVHGATLIEEGWFLEAAGLRLSTQKTSGHSVAGITYLIEGMTSPIAVVGDAIFAGSMGGGMVSYAEALQNNREKILTLRDDTVLCPGHGPLTTVGQEKAHNPFYPEFK
jgi:hydroxyacylglutathione hydrolase